ncbi:unnamed protein product [Clavelina lepadiformis]|uniref:Rab-GAP TBC domain-containing protein n=1 Tax=Clavelina lepadiformis TaxID=159417 RepID=A0ABP0FVQ3_CLALP
MQSKRKLKAAHIVEALQSEPVDIHSLRKLSISPGGLLSRKLRCQVWPHLLDVTDTHLKCPKNVRMHPECRQVQLDVNRSGGRFPSTMPKEEVDILQEQLTDLILSVLCTHSELNYYQGYHDICVTFLLVCGKQLSFPLVERLSTYHLRDFMVRSMDSTADILNYLIPILEKSNPELVKYIEKSEVGTLFALSWLITWYSYVVPKQEDIERLYDFFLSCHPLMPVYFAAQIVLDNADNIMDGECEMARVYQVLLQTARKTDLPLETLISKAADFYIQFPPSSLSVTAIDYYKDGLAMSTFCDYALVAQHELPDAVLRRRGLYSSDRTESSVNTRPSNADSTHWSAAKTAAVAVGGAVGAAAIAGAVNLLEWAPHLLGYL